MRRAYALVALVSQLGGGDLCKGQVVSALIGLDTRGVVGGAGAVGGQEMRRRKNEIGPDIGSLQLNGIKQAVDRTMYKQLIKSSSTDVIIHRSGISI